MSSEGRGLSRLGRWWRCWQNGHQALVYGPTIVPNKVIVRCDCGHKIKPTLAYVEALDV